ncbi:MAG: CapA family protein [Victivallales bacterium]|nr:CapA family protein [Victivallales bacterium]
MNLDKNGFVQLRKAGKETATIVVTGDCCPRSPGEQLILDGKAEEIMEPVMEVFQGADLSIMQFETPLTMDETPIVKSGPNLKCHPDTIDLLHAWGGDVALLANNHIGDYGPKPVLETMDILKQNGFKSVGAGKNLDAAYKPLVCDAGGIKVGILNIAENEFGSAGPDKPGAAPLNPCLNIRQIMKLSKKVDVCMVITHGGNEHNPLPSPRVVDMSRAFAEAGADVVINIHPHCPQGYEYHEGSLIVYSLGNFYFPWPTDRSYKPDKMWTLGYVAKLTIDAKGICAFQAIPVQFDIGGAFVKSLSAKQNARFAAYLDEISQPIADPAALQKYYEGWVANSGYANYLVNSPVKSEDFAAPAPNPKLMPLRNLFTCEAHNDLLKTYMRLVEEGRVEEAKANLYKAEFDVK